MTLPFIRNNLYWQPIPDAVAPKAEAEVEILPDYRRTVETADPRWTGISNAEREWMESVMANPPAEDVRLEPTILRLGTNETRLWAGRDVHLGNTFFNLLGGNVYIQDCAFFGQGCQVLTGSHDYRRTMRDRHPLEPRRGNDVVIEQGAWIASGTIIIGPCRIGAHAVVGAGSVVLPGDYEGGCIYAGNPAQLKKRIEFTTE